VRGYSTQITTNHSVTSTAMADGSGGKQTTINNWQDSVNDVANANVNNGARGKVFYQELGD
jgi:hypothetical protein